MSVSKKAIQRVIARRVAGGLPSDDWKLSLGQVLSGRVVKRESIEKPVAVFDAQFLSMPHADEQTDDVPVLALLLERSQQRVLDSRCARHSASAGERLMESLSCGVGVCAGDGRLLHKNTALRNWLHLRDGLQDVHGRLELMQPREDSHWLELIGGCGTAQYLQYLKSATPFNAMHVTRPSGKPACILQLLPLLYKVVDCPAADHAVALVRITDPAAAPSGYHEILQQLYRLSAAEVRLLERLLEGEQIKQAAYHLHISEHTARSELKSIFAKTGTHRQAQLMRLVMSLAMG